MKLNIWEGIYKDFKETPASGMGFDDSIWLSNCEKRLAQFLERTSSANTIPQALEYRTTPLPILASLLGSDTRKVRILDYGGGLGLTYLELINTFPGSQSIEYHVIEKKGICEKGKEVFKDDKRINFYTSIPDNLRVDIVNMHSSLHYIEDWKGLIQRLAECQNEYFIFGDLTAGDIPTYATVQNYYGSKIPVWFFNVNEFIDTVSGLGFKLIFNSHFEGSFFGKAGDLPQDNMPAEVRLKKTCILIFRKEIR